MSNASQFAMYVIGRVESNHNWAAVNYNDPITLGMMQWYGGRARNLIDTCRNKDATGWDTFKQAAPTLAAQVTANNIAWNTRYVTQAEGQAWVAWAQRSENHAAQEEVWESDYNNYNNVCNNYGFPQNNIKERIFFMSMYHQSPASAVRVLRSTSATATLSLLHNAALTDSVLGRYRTRYDTAYKLLNEWDGTSAPPNFGQASKPSDTPTGNAPTDSGTSTESAWIQANGDSLYLFDKGEIRTFYPSTNQDWLETTTPGIPVDPGKQTDKGSDTSSDAGAKVVAWVRARINKYNYSQAGGRLNPESTGYTDCSALWWRAYMDITGVDVGTWTGQQAGKGKLIASSQSESIASAIPKVKAGDLLLLGRRPNFDHVEGFTQDARAETLSHGGPGRGPNLFDANTEARYFSNSWEIRRYV